MKVHIRTGVGLERVAGQVEIGPAREAAKQSMLGAETVIDAEVVLIVIAACARVNVEVVHIGERLARVRG